MATADKNDDKVTPSSKHEGGLTIGGQIERYRTAFISIISMVLLAAVVGGYILSHENLKLPGWVPVLGRNFYTLKAEFQTAQAVTPGQGQAVTIAGAKIGEVGSVELHNGVAVVTMKVTPKYARIYRNATMLLRPKTQLQDITVEVDPGTPRPAACPAAPRCRSRRRRRTSTSTSSSRRSTPKRAPICRSCSRAPAKD
jgi:ABC-type transporter Mla subunit MlaD